VVLLHHYAWWFTHGDGLDRGLYYRAGEAQLQVFANVSVALGVGRRVAWRGWQLQPGRRLAGGRAAVPCRCMLRSHTLVCAPSIWQAVQRRALVVM
jgi:hypothetical protein